MPFFFRTWKDIEIVLCNLAAMRCPLCGASGTLIRHGFLRGFVAHNRRGIRGRRVRCKRSPRRKGCAHTFSLRITGTLPRRCFNAQGLWAFIQGLREGRSIKAAWEGSATGLSLDTGYRVFQRLQLCRAALRTRLCNRSPPPEKGEDAGSALLRTFAHLEGVFGNECAVSAYQEALQKDFLAIA